MTRLLSLTICASMLVSAGCRRAVPMPEEPPETGDPFEVIHALEVLRVKLDFDAYDHITKAGFVGTDITDEDLKLLIGLKHIDQLNLIGTDITDRGLRYLGQVRGVRYMFLNKTNITQEGVWRLEKDIPETKLITAYWDQGDADPKEPPKVYEYAEDLKDKRKPVYVHPVTIKPDKEEGPKKPTDDKKPKDNETKPDDDGKKPVSEQVETKPEADAEPKSKSTAPGNAAGAPGGE
jgi:hypothetical protein